MARVARYVAGLPVWIGLLVAALDWRQANADKDAGLSMAYWPCRHH